MNGTETVELTATEYKYLIAYELENNNKSKALAVSKEALNAHPDQPELMYLAGTVYADVGLFDEAKALLGKSIDQLEFPNPAIFQLGLIFYTSGQFELADEAWMGLVELDESHYLLRFVQGLQALIENEFHTAIDLIQQGIRVNNELTQLNHDMQRVCEEIASVSAPDESEEANHILLSGYKNN